MSNITPGNPDRAWNDPPLLEFKAAGSGIKDARRKIMNKRIPIPLQQISEKQDLSLRNKQCVESLSSSFSNSKLPLTHANSMNLKCSDLEDFSKELYLALENIIHIKDFAAYNDGLQHLFIMWEENRISFDTKQKLISLVAALSQRNSTLAVSTFAALEPRTECSIWMNTIESLISCLQRDVD